MKVITAVEDYKLDGDDITCFLAGGINKCPNWQKEVIEELKKLGEFEHLVIFNPRRDNFPIDDPNASEEQIKWEFKWLSLASIFSMYFCNSESVQPICFYELGRNLATRKRGTGCFVISVEDGFSRGKDVSIQTALALGYPCVHFHATPEKHAKRIAKQYEHIMNTL